MEGVRVGGRVKKDREENRGVKEEEKEREVEKTPTFI